MVVLGIRLAVVAAGRVRTQVLAAQVESVPSEMAIRVAGAVGVPTVVVAAAAQARRLRLGTVLAILQVSPAHRPPTVQVIRAWSILGMVEIVAIVAPILPETARFSSAIP